jgi:hypothetical protein
VRINCHVPITVRIVGAPTDEQLTVLAAALVRTVTAQLREAERVLADRHGAGDRGPAEIRERYDPNRHSFGGYDVPSYGDEGRPRSVRTTDPASTPAAGATRRPRKAATPAAPAAVAGSAVAGSAGQPAGSSGQGSSGSPANAAPPRRTSIDIVTSSQQIQIDLHPESFDPASGVPEPTPWREVEFLPGQTQIVYILSDARTGEPLKVGKTTRDRFVSRFGEYVAAGNKWGRRLRVTMFTMRRRSNKNVEEFERDIRSGMERSGFRLPWDNTKRRLGRSGKGIPEPTTFSEELAVIDQVETAAAAGEAAAAPAEPARAPAEPARTEPVRAEPARTEPVRAEPARTEPARTEPEGGPAVPPTSTLPSRPPGPSVAATPRSAGLRVAAGLGAAMAVANELLGSYNQAIGASRAGIAEGKAEIEFWEWAGAKPVAAVWDAWDKVALPKDTPVEATAVWGQRRPFVVDIDVNALRHALPTKIHNYDEFVYFLDAARELHTIQEVPPLPDRPDATQRYLAEHVRYYVVVNKEDIPHKKVHDITDIMVPIRTAMLAQLDAAMRAEVGQLSVAQRHQIYRLKRGAETKLYRSQGGHFNQQPLVSAQRTLGPDPWVRLFEPGSSANGRVQVTPANADAGRGRVTTYFINQWIVDVEKEVKEHGRPILTRDDSSGALESFVAGPQPDNPRFGNTRYVRHDDETSRRTVAIGELNVYWVDLDDIELVGDREINLYVQQGGTF